MTYQRLGTILLEQGLVSLNTLDYAIGLQSAGGSGTRLGRILIEQGIIEKTSLSRVLAKQAGWSFYEGPYVLDNMAVQKAGIRFFREHSVFPVKSPRGYTFILPDGNNTKATDHLSIVFGSDLFYYIGVESEISFALASFEMGQVTRNDGPINELKELIDKAVIRGASDIHVEPAESTINIRLRVDGVMQFLRALPKKDLSRIVNLAFNRAGISAGDFMRFHDARFEEECCGKKIDIRLSHIPTDLGSSLVLRVLDKSRSAIPLEDLGYSMKVYGQLQEALKRPNGLFIFTGPTGCGKTTSLYSLLNSLKGLHLKVVTVEDPIEVRMPLVTQVGIDLRREQDFHHITRALLRHDPDVILIGEIRDEKTAREAVRAALTGHRVLATLHTNDVTGAILRLRDLGIDYPQISHSLHCVVAQRLVRKLCSHCRTNEPVHGPYTSAPVGCSLCDGGYKGRTVAAELMSVTDEMRSLIEQGLIQEAIAKFMGSTGRITMMADAIRLKQQGVIDALELERVFG